MRRFTRTALFTSALAFVVVACGDDPIAPPEPTTLSIVSGNGQSLDPGATSAALTVLVVDQNSDPMEGVTVTFSGSGVEHTLSALSATTDATGQASVTATAGAVAGSFDVEASVSGVDPVTFQLDVNAPRATTMTLVSGDAQSLDYNEVSAALVVEVRDQSSDPLQGVTVTFTGSGVAHSLSAGTATTGADGRAQITLTAGVVPGDIDVAASVSGVTPVTFGLTVLDAPFSVTAPSNVRGVAFDGTWLWAVGGADASPVIYRLDPVDGSVEQSFNAPAADHRGLAWDGTNLWYSSWATKDIYKINPGTGAVITSFASPTSEPRGLTWDGTALWHNGRTGGVGTGRVYKLDATNGNVLSDVASPVDDPLGLTWDGTHLWTAQYANGVVANRFLVRFGTDGVIASQLPNPGTFPIGLAFDSSGPWLWAADSGAGVIHRIKVTP